MSALDWNLFVLGVFLAIESAFGSEFEFQALFTRIPQNYINAFPLKVLENATVENCARSCVREVEFECKSFDIDNIQRECHLHNHSHTERLIGLQESLTMDHYRTGYEKLFSRVPNHIITIKHKRNIRVLTVEECARRCLQEMTFNCRGFDYETRRRNCWLTDKGLEDAAGLKKRPNTDFYGRKTNGHLSRFINYGYGSLQPVEGIQIHNKLVLGVNLRACAQLCLAETAFKCASFDYVFGEQSCQMSHLIAANVHGMRTDFDKPNQVMHFELIEENLGYFYPTPYASVLGNNDKTYRKITPDTCARKCLEERDFICRSFDYQVTEGTCLLSHVTGSDAGGLYTPNGVHVHHFELKPSLAFDCCKESWSRRGTLTHGENCIQAAFGDDSWLLSYMYTIYLKNCGDELRSERGSLASPNWPRHYSHHLNCTWSIKVPKFKVVRFEIYHLDLGSQTENPCDKANDVLVFSEIVSQKRSCHCARNYLTEFTSRTNNVDVTFTTNAENDAQGFRLFYNADWPCSTNLTVDNGEFASPRWPLRYPPMTSCSYRITGPLMSQIYLRFNSVKLEDHLGSRCTTAYDKIVIYDGNSSSSPLLDTLCGAASPLSLKSTLNILYIEFISDSRVQSEGFHASYKLIYPSTTSTSSTTSTTSVTTGAITTLRTLLNNTNVSDVKTADDISEHNSSISVNLALHDRGDDYDILEAGFIEPTELEEDDIGQGDIPSDPGITGDDIGRGEPSDKSTVFEHHEKMMRAIIWGTAASFLLIFIVVLVTILMVCRQHRKRTSKHREGTNMRYPEEHMSLFGQTGEVCAQDFEEDVDDDARLPLPSSPDPPPDVEFLNPLYVQRHKDDSNVIKEEISDLETDTLNNKHLATTNADESETLLVQRSQHLAIDLETDRDIGEILC